MNRYSNLLRFEPQQRLKPSFDRPGENRAATFWAPEEMIFQTKNSCSVFGVTIHKSDYLYSCRESYKEKGARLARLPLPAEAGSPRRELICGMRTRTAKIFASTMLALRLPFSFSTISTRLRSVTSLLRMRNVDNGRSHRAGFDSIGRSYFL